MNATASFSEGALKVEDLGDGQWRLLEGFKHFPAGTSSGTEIQVPAGFATDFGSVPQAFRNIVEGIGTRRDKAYVLHDWLYATEYFSWIDETYKFVPDACENRKLCDWLLLEAMQACGDGWLTRNMIWSAVRAGGGAVWKEHSEASVKAARLLRKI